jgi:integrase
VPITSAVCQSDEVSARAVDGGPFHDTYLKSFTVISTGITWAARVVRKWDSSGGRSMKTWRPYIETCTAAFGPQRLWGERGRHSEWVFTFVAKRTRTCPKTDQKYIDDKRYPITYWSLSTHRRCIRPKAGVVARWRDLRHSAGMRTVRATGSLRAVQRLVGHSDIATRIGHR